MIANTRVSDNISGVSVRCYAAKGKAKELTEAEIQAQKYSSEMQYKEKTSLRGRPFNFQDAEVSIKYMESEGR